MLVLGRKENESIVIGDSIRITIVGRSGSSIRVGIQAPRDVKVMREELELVADPSASVGERFCGNTERCFGKAARYSGNTAAPGSRR